MRMESSTNTTLLVIQDCVRCPVLVASRRRIVHGYGDPAARIVLIGEAPGRHGADKTGIPFSGDRSGARLRRMLEALGLADPVSGQLRCFVSNAVRCCPPHNRTPTAHEITNCAAFLDSELQAIAPRLIVPIGRVALQAVARRYLATDPGPIRPLHALPIMVGETVIVPMVHPSRISHAQVTAFVAVMRELMGEAGRGS